LTRPADVTVTNPKLARFVALSASFRANFGVWCEVGGEV
jgi:hypothetical protein